MRKAENMITFVGLGVGEVLEIHDFPLLPLCLTFLILGFTSWPLSYDSPKNFTPDGAHKIWDL